MDKAQAHIQTEALYYALELVECSDPNNIEDLANRARAIRMIETQIAAIYAKAKKA